jgi:sporulation protein YlmC with PRC-barrel domain
MKQFSRVGVFPPQATVCKERHMSDSQTATPLHIDETNALIASNKIEGTSVYAHDGQHLGEIYNFMVNKRTGQAEYAVLSFGGFLGFGENFYPLPWKALTYDTERNGYVIGLSKEKLDTAPRYPANQEPEYTEAYRNRIYDYYGYPMGPII